jgi:hypothetical protein
MFRKQNDSKIIQTSRFYLIDAVRARALWLAGCSFRFAGCSFRFAGCSFRFAGCSLCLRVARDASSKRRCYLSLSLQLEKNKIDFLI